MSEKLYDLNFSPATPHDDAVWTVFGVGFGLRSFPNKEAAVREAEAYFGNAMFTIRIWPDRTQLRVLAAPGANPEMAINQAIAALEAERDALKNCPAHSKGVIE